MTNKYKVIIIAYKDVDEKIMKSISQYSVRDISSVEDVENVATFCSRGFNLNDRICIYLGWYHDKAKEMISSGYKVSILEVPYQSSKPKEDAIDFLDEALEEDLEVIGKVDV